jgi:pimeloyl-ACP methyl ester carboxylesterase
LYNKLNEHSLTHVPEDTLEDQHNYRNDTITLPDGRALGYLELGAPQGQPLIIMHGMPGSRYDGLYVHEDEYIRHNVRAILPDRPGIGLSDFQPRRTILDWPADVSSLADALGLERFSVLGISVGGPFALACALKIPDRMKSAGVVSSIAPLNIPGITQGMGPGRLFFSMGRRAPWLVHLQFNMLKGGLQKNPAGVVKQVQASFPPPDLAVFVQDHVQEAFQKSLKEMMRNGTRGLVYEAGLLARPWGFSPADIRMPVQLWYGGQDTNTPPKMGKYLAEQIPHVDVHFKLSEGHFSIIINQFSHILQQLLQ